MIRADTRLIAERCAAVAISHEQPAIAEAKQEGRQAPDADRMRLAPRSAAVGRFALQRLAGVRFVVIADVGDEPAITGFDGAPELAA
jgi:hypothetical protein